MCDDLIYATVNVNNYLFKLEIWRLSPSPQVIFKEDLRKQNQFSRTKMLNKMKDLILEFLNLSHFYTIQKLSFLKFFLPFLLLVLILDYRNVFNKLTKPYQWIGGCHGQHFRESTSKLIGLKLKVICAACSLQHFVHTRCNSYTILS
jgi:hypothetical protein